MANNVYKLTRVLMYNQQTGGWQLQHQEAYWMDISQPTLYIGAYGCEDLLPQAPGHCSAPPFLVGEKWIWHPPTHQMSGWQLAQRESNWAGGPRTCFGCVP